MEDKKKKVVLQELAASPTPSRARSRRTALLVVQGLQTAPGVPVRWSPPPDTRRASPLRRSDRDRTRSHVGHVEVEEAQSDRGRLREASKAVEQLGQVGLSSGPGITGSPCI